MSEDLKERLINPDTDIEAQNDKPPTRQIRKSDLKPAFFKTLAGQCCESESRSKAITGIVGIILIFTVLGVLVGGSENNSNSAAENIGLAAGVGGGIGAVFSLCACACLRTRSSVKMYQRDNEEYRTQQTRSMLNEKFDTNLGEIVFQYLYETSKP